MKKKMIPLLLILALTGFMFVACTDSDSREPDLVPYPEPPPTVSGEDYLPEVGDSSPEEPQQQVDSLTAEEFGEIIIQGYLLSRDLIFPGWYMYQHEGEERTVATQWGSSIGFRVLPSSGFETIADIRAAFLPYFTEEMVDGTHLLGWGAAFYEEYNGNLYFFPYRASDLVRVWEEARFEIIEQDGSHTVIEVIVPATAEGQEWIETIHYTFLYDRVSERERIWD